MREMLTTLRGASTKSWVPALAMGLMAGLSTPTATATTVAQPTSTPTPQARQPKAPQQVIAVPYYTPGMYVQGILRSRHAPLAAWLAQQTQTLAASVEAWCSAPPAQADVARTAAREQWAQTMVAWTSLSTVAFGPLIERRSIRQIDFQPTRPALIQRAIEAAPAHVQALDTVGAPARGLPALEWLLWSQPAVAPASPACRYSIVLAQELVQESAALDAAFAKEAARAWTDEEETAPAVMAEVVNQWVGSLEQLRWRDLGKPLASAPKGQAPEFPRALSRKTTMAWAAQWQAIKVLSAQGTAPVPPANAGLLVPIETYLRGRGLNPAANALARAVAQADVAMKNLSPRQPPARLQAAMAALGQLKQVVEDQVAPALEISIGFSDADGD